MDSKGPDALDPFYTYLRLPEKHSVDRDSEEVPLVEKPRTPVWLNQLP